MFGPGSVFRERQELESGGKNGYKLPLIELHDDNIDALRIVLNILHSRHSKVPETITFNQLLDIAILADNYQLQEPLKIWAEKWMTAVFELRAGFIGQSGSQSTGRSNSRG